MNQHGPRGCAACRWAETVFYWYLYVHSVKTTASTETAATTASTKSTASTETAATTARTNST